MMNPPRRIAARFLTSSLAAFAVCLAAVAGSPPASAATLGSPNLGGYCNFKHGTNVLFSAGPLNLFDAYSWRCTLPPGSPVDGIDVNAACRWQYGNGAYGYTTNRNWAHSWQCRR